MFQRLSRLWWNWQFCKDLQIGVIPFPSIGLGSRTTTTISYKLQRCQVEGNDNPYWRSLWPLGVNFSELEQNVNTYLTEMSRFLRANSLLILAPKSSVTLYTPDPAQVNTRPKIKIANSERPLVSSPKILRVYLDTFSFNNHCIQVANRVSKTNNILKALAGTN